jgi:hypothetical protein
VPGPDDRIPGSLCASVAAAGRNRRIARKTCTNAGGTVVADPTVMSRFSLAACATLAMALGPRAADAQSCHLPAPTPPEGTSLHLVGEAAVADVSTGLAHWQGLGVAAAWRSRRVALRGSVTAYHLEVAGERYAGLGDVQLEARGVLIARARLDAGVGLGLGLPLGAADAGLGAGHLMAMPGLWAARRGERTTVDLSAFVHRAAGDVDAHASHHHPTGGVAVNPMNPTEVGGGARLTYAATSALSPFVTGLAALPIGPGRSRGLLGGGLALRRPDTSWQLSGEVVAPVLGDPYAARAAVVLSWWL